MKETRIAGRYAKALFELAQELKVLKEVYQDAQLVHTVCVENKEFTYVLRSPVIKGKKKISIIREIFKGKVHELTEKFLVIITRNGREEFIQDISAQVVDVYKKFAKILPAHLTTASTLDPANRKEIIELVKNHYDWTIELDENVDEDIIGGFVLRFKDKQYDASLSRQIAELKRDFKVNLYEKGF